MAEQKRYAIVGVGARHEMFRRAILEDFRDTAQLVGLCDTNPGRIELAVTQMQNQISKRVPGYRAEQFDRMVAECRPDTVIVTSIDKTHDHYICLAMELGCDVITEKPMTIDEMRCRRIVDTQRATGRDCRVTFNYRYSPPRTQVKDLLMSGVIGDVLSVDFHWMLDTSHGADYFRRWHRNKQNSGGLMIHKATHHFDLVNWWLSTVPERVYASGQRQFYTPHTANRYGLTRHGERCHDCPEASTCPFVLSLADNEGLKELYLEQEKHDSYHRDRCVFGDTIDIEDSVNVVVDYRSGARMSYSLNTFMPWEGYTITFNGTKGRLEHKCEESAYVSADGSIPGALRSEGTYTRIYPHWAPAYEVEIWRASGGHGGGDEPLLRDIFDPDPSRDQYRRAADQRAGAWSILVGVAANRSMERNQPVRIEELVPGLEVPDYPPMPSSDEPLPGKSDKNN